MLFRAIDMLSTHIKYWAQSAATTPYCPFFQFTNSSLNDSIRKHGHNQEQKQKHIKAILVHIFILCTHFNSSISTLSFHRSNRSTHIQNTITQTNPYICMASQKQRRFHIVTNIQNLCVYSIYWWLYGMSTVELEIKKKSQ